MAFGVKHENRVVLHAGDQLEALLAGQQQILSLLDFGELGADRVYSVFQLPGARRDLLLQLDVRALNLLLELVSPEQMARDGRPEQNQHHQRKDRGKHIGEQRTAHELCAFRAGALDALFQSFSASSNQPPEGVSGSLFCAAGDRLKCPVAVALAVDLERSRQLLELGARKRHELVGLCSVGRTAIAGDVGEDLIGPRGKLNCSAPDIPSARSEENRGRRFRIDQEIPGFVDLIKLGAGDVDVSCCFGDRVHHVLRD